MRLLVCLAQRAGEVVSIEELLGQVWPDVTVTQDSVYQAVASLRRVLGDDPKQPTYIATVPRLGYRMLASVNPSSIEKSETRLGTCVHELTLVPRRVIVLLAGVVLVCAMLVVLLYLRRGGRASQAIAAPPEQSIAVLPFLDLTEGMKEEEFADGMTEELIGRFSKIPGLRVPSPTSVFYFKNKSIPVADIAKRLGVVYVLDGSVRKSGSRVRVAARLTRAETGYVIWAESYDRPFDDILMVQDDIAGEVTKALKSSIATERSSRIVAQ